MDHRCQFIITGDDLSMDVVAAANTTTADLYPIVDTTGYTNTATKVTYKVKITEVSGANGFEWHRLVHPSSTTDYSGSPTDITGSYQAITDGITIKFPQTTGYTVSDEWTIVLHRDPDLVLKSAIGKRYGFPNLQYIDLELPNTGITAMAAAGDRLLVFSADMLNIVNVAQDYEFLEASLQGHGIDSKKMVCRVLEGVAFANSTGVYYFDGNNMNAISDKKMGDVAWSGAVAVSYLPDEKLICVWYNTNDVLAYSLVTNEWVSNSLALDIPLSNTAFYQNKAHFLKSGPALKQLTMGNGDLVETYQGRRDLKRFILL